MKNKAKSIRVGVSKVLWVVLVVLMCAGPDALCDYTVPAGAIEDIDFFVSMYLWVYGTANLLPGADIEWFVMATDGSTVNIKGGDVGYWVDVAPGAQVTVYGTNFNLGEGEHFIDYGTVTGFYENGDPINLTFDCQSGATVTLAPPGPGPEEPIPVDIDIKPGSDPNPINPGSNGVIPVAIFTTDQFDAATVDPGTVTLAGANVATRGKSEKLMARLEDVDGDGDDDLMLQVDTFSEDEVGEGGTVILEGLTYDGQEIEGTDNVVIVPPQ